MNADHLAQTISPLIQLEMASIGAILTATGREPHAGYVMLFHETKTSKQASVEQMSTVLRMGGKPRVEAAGAIEPMLRLQTLALQKTSTTALLQAMRLVEATLLERYAKALDGLSGLEAKAVEAAYKRCRKHWMVLTAHIAQRKDGESSHAAELPHALASYFASNEDRVCMRCLLDRPGARPPLEKENPYTYVCGACHEETEAEFPPDLQLQMTRWADKDRKNRVIHKALSRPLKIKAVKEVHSVLAGLPAEPPAKVPGSSKSGPAIPPAPDYGSATPLVQPASDLSVPAEGAAGEEIAYTNLLFDYRSVRKHW